MSAPPQDRGRQPVAGIVLAGGRSSRMGEPKALLDVEGTSFLERAARVLAEGGCDPVFVVVPPGETGERLLELARRAGARGIVNPEPDAEQIDSLRVGLEALEPHVVAAAVLPVDHPRVRTATIAALLAAFHASGAPIVRPIYGDRPGHPVLFARDLWTELRAPDLEEGARDVVHRHHGEIEEVPVDDPGLVIDVNTPEEYAREVKAV
ncbi:MAG: nucleotidyltransferase family protein [Gemmatimonadota bacterium]